MSALREQVIQSNTKGLVNLSIGNPEQKGKGSGADFREPREVGGLTTNEFPRVSALRAEDNTSKVPAVWAP